MLENKIEISGLSKSFGAIKALDNISLTLEGSGPFGIVGPDGAGKTTFMRILSAVMTFKGKISVLGAEYPKDSNNAKRFIGYMPQVFGLYKDLSVKENLIFFAELFGMKQPDIDNRMPELLEFSNLTSFIDRPAGKLSGGMKQKLALCACLIHEPKLLILDEPGAGVDPVSRREFWNIIGNLVQKGIMVVVSTTYMDEAQKCQRVVYLRDGCIHADGTVSEILSGYPLNLFSFSSQNLHDLKDRIMETRSFRSVNFFGNEIHASTELRKDEVKEKIAGILTSKFDDLSWDEINPGLEDVFVYLGDKAGTNYV
jgi:ABC-2 type transport system ATP-binding protein